MKKLLRPKGCSVDRYAVPWQSIGFRDHSVHAPCSGSTRDIFMNLNHKMQIYSSPNLPLFYVKISTNEKVIKA